MSEESKATWHKRFMQRHYSYRDYHSRTTSVLAELQALGLALTDLAAGLTSTAVLYVFGTNAKATINPYTFAVAGGPFPYGAVAWPANCYAREVLVSCDEDCWIKIVCLNPEYLRQSVLKATSALAVITTPMLLFENERFIPAGEIRRYFPTYGYAIVFRADTVQGTLEVDVEGNVEGTE